jgi:hypothetical protein
LALNEVPVGIPGKPINSPVLNKQKENMINNVTDIMPSVNRVDDYRNSEYKNEMETIDEDYVTIDHDNVDIDLP